MKSFRFVSAASVAGLAAASLAMFGTSVRADHYASKPTCAEGRLVCTEVANPTEAFGNYYVGHDEPSVLFHSSVPGSGNHVQYQVTIPTEPTGAFSQTNGYDFELRPTFWFGMVLCDTQSYPEQSSKCTPDSDSNIVDPNAGFAGAAGLAFEELQFYPPGWVKQFAGFDCDPVKWCVALTIDSLAEDPINGTLLNPTCQSEILGGLEYVNFAFLTLDGTPLGPPNPLQFDASTSGNPTNPDTFFLNQGDQATVTLTDTAHGLQTSVQDVTTGQTGTMTASAANGFGQIKYQHGGHSCQMLPYDFHPAYSTSSAATTVRWAAHGYNTSFSDEIGHFDFCSSIDPNSPEASCNGVEGPTGDQEAADGDDNFCFSAAQSMLYPATGCIDSNAPGFDGQSYQDVWPNAGSLNSPTTRPTPVRFTAPLTGSGYTTPFENVAFEVDLPRIEAADLGGACQRLLALPNAGSGCVNPPVTDEGAPATFYPYYTQLPDCFFVEGGNFATGNDFGGSSTAEFGPIKASTYWTFRGHGATNQRYNNFNSGDLGNSC